MTRAAILRFWCWIAFICVIIIIAAVFFDRYLSRAFHPAKRQVGVYSKIQNDLQATERDGRPAQLSELRGKVFVCAYLYTICPHGCAAVMGEMNQLFKNYGHRNDFHLVSLTVVPEHDTPAYLTSYAEGMGLNHDAPWWFLTGERGKIWNFMTDELKLEPSVPIPEDERLNPLDLYQHDLRIVLVDRSGQVRGYYSVLHPQPEIASLMKENLQRDVRTVLNESQP
jgi:cytochrome oxidase Cu insertion factor (SCO1/SenC/PrrC family)